MTAHRHVVIAVVAVLAMATAVFALRSWVGLEPAEKSASTSSESSTVAAPEPSASPSAQATPSPTASPSPSATPPALPPAPQPGQASGPMSTSGVTSAIRSRTQAVAGRSTSVSCPATVPAAKGTRFRCTVAYASRPSVPVADATVRITGPGGRFVWESRSRG